MVLIDYAKLLYTLLLHHTDEGVYCIPLLGYLLLKRL